VRLGEVVAEGQHGPAGVIQPGLCVPQGSGSQAANCPHPAHLVAGDRCTGCGQFADSW
jgi:hypothetical protein